MKYRVAIVTKCMITGGVERALIAMLDRLEGKCIVDLYVLDHGKLDEEVPKWVNIIKLKTVSKKGSYKHPIFSIKKMIALEKSKRYNSYAMKNYYASKMLLPVIQKYDIAVSYHAPNTVPVFYVIDSIKATRKILWLHGDLETNNGNDPIVRQYYNKYDQVYAVSNYIRESFLRVWPERKDKIAVFYNFVNKKRIVKLAKEGESFQQNDKSKFKILTIGRLSYEKGYDLAIRAGRILVENEIPFVWYICGDGNEKSNIEDSIEKNNLSRFFKILGNKSNPYTYLKDCDLYVQPSRLEGFCTTTNEARLLCKPVITTDVSGAQEQFIDNYTGWIIPKENPEILAQKIIWCYLHEEQRYAVTEHLKTIEFEKSNDINCMFEGLDGGN